MSLSNYFHGLGHRYEKSLRNISKYLICPLLNSLSVGHNKLDMKILQRTLNFRFWQHNFKRKDFAILNEQDIDYFRSLLPNHSVVDDSTALDAHNLCFRKLDRGHSKLLLCPYTTEQVSKILNYCNNRKLAVVPQGGNTGLVGGSVPVFDEIIVNLKNMNKIEGFNEVSSIVGCESGVILEKLNEHL
jgi:D-2-hydroxyglutarate dehydrogenase